MKIRKTTKNGKPVWEVDMLASQVGSRKRVFGATREKAIAKANQHIQEVGLVSALGKLPPSYYITASKWSVSLTAEEMEAACREYAARKERAKTVAEAVRDYLAAPRATPISSVHYQPLRFRLDAFEGEFGERHLASLTPGELSDYILTKGRSAPNFFATLRALFRHAARREWIERNPFERIERPELPDLEKDVLTPDQMAEVLRVAAGQKGQPRDEELLRLLILGGFCGLRHSESLRQLAEEIDRESWEVHVTKMKTQAKGVRERYAQTEANAQEWLKWLDMPAAGQLINAGNWLIARRRLAACKAAGMKSWPHNVLRRSFASYHLASFGNAARTAEILGHTDAETTKAKYRVARKKEIADAWFSLTPALLS